MQPPSCNNEISFSYELVSKVENPIYGTTSPFNQAMTTLPTFFKADPALNITIFGEDLTEAWNTY
jgi:hypothetical protein